MPLKKDLSDKNTFSCITLTNSGQPSIKELNVARLHRPITPSSLQLGSSVALSPLKVVNLTLFDDADLFSPQDHGTQVEAVQIKTGQQSGKVFNTLD